jgi:energy-coupling factor transport system ATP-binding protein
MLIVDHAISNFIDIADEVIVLGNGGKILQRGINSGNLSSHTCTLENLGVSLPGAAYSTPAKEAQHRKILFSLQDVNIKYDGEDILHGVNIDFHKGCMTAITGKSGSGKSTLLATLARMTSYKGSIKMDDSSGQEIRKMPRKSYAKQVGIVFQNPQDQFVANTVYEEIAVSLRGKCKQEEMQPRIRSCLEEIGLWEYRNFSPYMLSQGQQRRLAVGALLAYDCKVLLCDEPTYGQDKRSIEAIMSFLQRRVEQDGLTVIFSTHDLILAKSYGEYHYCCEEGKIYNASKN